MVIYSSILHNASEVERAIRDILDWSWLIVIIQFAAFLIGATLSPLVRGMLSGIFQTAVMTLFVVLPTLFMWLGDPVGMPYALVMILGGAAGLSLWTNIRSRALEPGVNKGARAALLGGALLVWTFVVNMIDPIDLLYLLGIDLYRWM